MTKARFFVAPDAIQGTRISFTPEQSAQMYRVLRLTPGCTVYALDGRGFIYTVRLEVLGRQDAYGQIMSVRPAGGEPPIHLTLYQALLKGEKMDWVLQKGTEIGVSRFVPLLTARTIVRRREARARWQRILQEAAEQCGRAYIPELTSVLSWDEALDDSEGLRLIAHNGRGIPPFRSVMAQISSLPARVSIFIGPEGGFTEDEMIQAVERGLYPVHLGPRTLRAESAALVVATLLLYHGGDVG